MNESRDTRRVRVLIFAASLRRASLNRRLAELAAIVVEEHGGTADRATMADFDCPSFNGDVEGESGVPPGAQRLRDRLVAADAFLIASPEYNASMPGYLKNAIDWVSRIRPQPFNGRQGLLVSASPSMAGGESRLVVAAGAAGASRGAGLPRHVLAGPGAAGLRRGWQDRRPGAAGALRARRSNASSSWWRRPSTTARSRSSGWSTSASTRTRRIGSRTRPCHPERSEGGHLRHGPLRGIHLSAANRVRVTATHRTSSAGSTGSQPRWTRAGTRRRAAEGPRAG